MYILYIISNSKTKSITESTPNPGSILNTSRIYWMVDETILFSLSYIIELIFCFSSIRTRFTIDRSIFVLIFPTVCYFYFLLLYIRLTLFGQWMTIGHRLYVWICSRFGTFCIFISATFISYSLNFEVHMCVRCPSLIFTS